MSYALEKFGNAVRLLGRRKGGARHALFWAFVEIEPIVPEHDLPVSMKDEYEQIIKALTSKPAVADEGRARATIQSMNYVQLEAIVTRIRAFDKILRRQVQHHREHD